LRSLLLIKGLRAEVSKKKRRVPARRKFGAVFAGRCGGSEDD